MPLSRRVPKLKGFKNPFRVEYTVVNLDALEDFEGTDVTPETLRAHGLVHKRRHGQGPRPGRAEPGPAGLGPRLLRRRPKRRSPPQAVR